MTSQLLNWYEEGTWTPADASGAGLTFTLYYARYTRVGRLVNYEFGLSYPVTASAASASINGLPFSATNNTFGKITYTDAPLTSVTYLSGTGTTITFLTPGFAVPNANISGQLFIISGTYSV